MFLKNISYQYFNRFSVSTVASMMMATSAFAVAPPSDSFAVNGALETSDPNSARFQAGFTGSDVYQDVFRLTVTDAAAFLARLATGFDSFLVLYSDEYDPTDVDLNYATHDDDALGFAGDAQISPGPAIVNIHWL